MQDIHTHLYWHTYDPDRDAVVARARENGVKEMFVIGCTVEESKQAIALAEQYEKVFASVGIHPQEFVESTSVVDLDASIEVLRSLTINKKVVAIGECGLEYYAHDKTKPITEEQKNWQKAGFLAQIELAKECNLPLIVHSRGEAGESDVYEDLFSILSEHAKDTPTILHCYMGDTEVTKKLLTLQNVFFSFTGNITYPVKKSLIGTKDDLTETVKLIPLDRIFTETDCPFLTPQSKRGERNEPAYVSEVVLKIAELQGKSTLEIEQAIEKNFQKVFPNV